MKKLIEWLSGVAYIEVPFCVYGTLFYISYQDSEKEVWLDIDPDDITKRKKIKTEKELTDYIRENVEQSPLCDETIMFDVLNAVSIKIRRHFEFSK